MRTIFAAVFLAQLIATTTALAQSEQGGYLGQNSGAGLPAASTNTQSPHTSGQGGYLGKDPGANAPTGGSTQAVKGSGEGGYLGMPNVASPTTPK